jgi:methionyl-tRNA formyltransferase
LGEKKLTIFTLGYSDNTATAYLLDYFIKNGVVIDGAIFAKSKFSLNWKRLIHKIRMRGISATVKRVFENLFTRKKQVEQVSENIKKVFFVEEINSEEVRDILVTNGVDLLIMTSTPIIKPLLINIEGLTILNAHPGWLPKYRGLDANLKALRDGHQPGVSIHKVVEKIDAGEIYLRETFQIDPKENILDQMDTKELKLAENLLLKAINLKKEDNLKPLFLSETLGKYEPPLDKEEKNKILQRFNKTPPILSEPIRTEGMVK